MSLENSRHGILNALFRATVDNDACAFRRKSRSEGKANSGSRSSDQGHLVFEKEIHAET